MSNYITDNREKVRSQHPSAFVYLSLYGFHIAESDMMGAPTIGSGKTEAEAWAEAAERIPEGTNEAGKYPDGVQPSAKCETLSVGLCVGCETVRTLGFEWVKPRSYWEGDSGPYSGAVAIKTNVGHLVLERIEEFSVGSAGGIRRVIVRPEELNVQDA